MMRGRHQDDDPLSFMWVAGITVLLIMLVMLLVLAASLPT